MDLSSRTVNYEFGSTAHSHMQRLSLLMANRYRIGWEGRTRTANLTESKAGILPIRRPPNVWWEAVESNHTLLQNGFTDRVWLPANDTSQVLVPPLSLELRLPGYKAGVLPN